MTEDGKSRLQQVETELGRSLDFHASEAPLSHETRMQLLALEAASLRIVHAINEAAATIDHAGERIHHMLDQFDKTR